MLFILRLRSAIFAVVTSAEIIPSRQRGQFASSYIRIGEFVPELPRNPNLCGTPDPESHGRLPAPLRGLDYLVGQVLADNSQAEKVLEGGFVPPTAPCPGGRLAPAWQPQPSHQQCAKPAGPRVSEIAFGACGRSRQNSSIVSVKQRMISSRGFTTSRCQPANEG